MVDDREQLKFQLIQAEQQRGLIKQLEKLLRANTNHIKDLESKLKESEASCAVMRGALGNIAERTPTTHASSSLMAYQMFREEVINMAKSALNPEPRTQEEL